jgi:PhnB protein
MESIVPYLTLNGNATDALDFYAKALNGNIESCQTFGDAKMEVPEENKNNILHAVLKAGDLTMMFSDSFRNANVSQGSNLALSLNFNELEEMEKVFGALSAGAKITMPLQDTFWGAKFGQLTDKFGFNWMFNHDYKK